MYCISIPLPPITNKLTINHGTPPVVEGGGREALQTATSGGYGGAMGSVVGGVGSPVMDDAEDKEVTLIVGRIIDVTAIDDALALAKMTAGNAGG